MTEQEAILDDLEQFLGAVKVWRRTRDPDMRTLINQSSKKVQTIIQKARCFKTLTISPPPAIGGVIMRNVNPFDAIYDGAYGTDVSSVVTDMVEQAIGVVKSGEFEKIEKERETVRRTMSNKKVFIVHGHDEEVKQTVARFTEQLGLTAIILHERPSEGRAIIEKFEANSDVGFAVVLLTPDDVGGKAADPSACYKSRARQNVIFELGYFFGKIGREKVCALLKGDVERPSDYDGIAYVALDPGGGWKMLLAREMKAAGLDVDLNKAI